MKISPIQKRFEIKVAVFGGILIFLLAFAAPLASLASGSRIGAVEVAPILICTWAIWFFGPRRMIVAFTSIWARQPAFDKEAQGEAEDVILGYLINSGEFDPDQSYVGYAVVRSDAAYPRMEIRLHSEPGLRGISIPAEVSRAVQEILVGNRTIYHYWTTPARFKIEAKCGSTAQQKLDASTAFGNATERVRDAAFVERGILLAWPGFIDRFQGRRA